MMLAKTQKLQLFIFIGLTFVIASCGAEPPPPPPTDIPPTAVPPSATEVPTRTPIPTGKITLCLIVEKGTVVEFTTARNFGIEFDKSFHPDASGCDTLTGVPAGIEIFIRVHDNPVDLSGGGTYLCDQIIVNLEPGQTYEIELSVPSCEWSD